MNSPAHAGTRRTAGHRAERGRCRHCEQACRECDLYVRHRGAVHRHGAAALPARVRTCTRRDTRERMGSHADLPGSTPPPQAAAPGEREGAATASAHEKGEVHTVADEAETTTQARDATVEYGGCESHVRTRPHANRPAAGRRAGRRASRRQVRTRRDYHIPHYVCRPGGGRPTGGPPQMRT